MLISQGLRLDIARVRDFCSDRYGLSNRRLALFGVSMGHGIPQKAAIIRRPSTLFPSDAIG